MTNLTKAAPRLSIGLPVYNGERFLAQALECLLAQTFRDFELVVSDNASTDRTAEICQAYLQRDPRVRYVRNPRNIGSVANFNRVFEISTAPLFKWASHDDLHHETHIESCIRLLDENPDVVLAHSATAFIDENGELFPASPETGDYIDPKTGAHVLPDGADIGNSPVAVKRFWQVLSRARWGTHQFGVIRRASLQQTRLDQNFSGGDRAMLAELALLGRFQSNPERLFLKRFHPDVSWALNQTELKRSLSTDSKPYWRRARQLEAFFSAPNGKPINTRDKSICIMMVAAHCARTACGAGVAGDNAREAAQGLIWRGMA
jgi:glycosyltransferase involved in cell wall biosynthesis